MLLIFLFSFINIFSQKKSYTLNYIINDSVVLKKKLNKRLLEKIKDTNRINDRINNFINKLQSSGYLELRIDSLLKIKHNYICYLSFGNQYFYSKISFENIDKKILKKLRIKSSYFEKKAFNYFYIEKIKQKIINYYENNSFPFAKIETPKFRINDNKIDATYNIVKGSKIIIKDIIVKGSAGVSKSFIENYIDIKTGEKYNEEKIKKIDNKIDNLNFLASIKSSQIEFFKQYAKLYLYINEKKSNSFSGIVGFSTKNENDKLMFTGNIKLSLRNVFHKGENINLYWDKTLENNQSIKISFAHPYLFSSLFGINLKFKFFKIDSSYLKFNYNLGINYQLNTNEFFEFFVDYEYSAVLLKDEITNNNIENYKAQLYGVKYSIERLDYKLNPQKGYSIGLQISGGNRTAKTNDKQNKIKAKSIFQFYIPIANSFVVRLKTYNAFMYTKDSLYYNELFQIGGLNSIRGFDSNSIKASAFTINTLELRYILDKNSSIYAFYDMAYYEKKTNNKLVTDIPFGFGIGFNINTKSGIFSFNYSLGKQFDNKLKLNNTKVHFGYITIF